MGEDGAKINPNDKYVMLLQSHISDVASHQNGTKHAHGRMPPSYFPPCGYWTEEDKDIFFRALSVHSRLRPDLIAAEIPGKTIADVCVYLELLAEGCAREPSKFRRSKFPCAQEVSDKWLEFEEEQSHAIVALEPIWAAESRMDEREAAFRAEKRALREQRTELKGRAVNKDDKKQRDAILREIRDKQEAEEEKEEHLAELDSACLKAIDNILREAEELVLNADSLGTSDLTSPEQPIISADSRVANANIEENSVLQPAPNLSSDPEGRKPPQSEGNKDAIPQNTSPAAGPSVIGALGTDTATIEDDFADNLAGTVTALVRLSPRSRRRYQKRLYMRRKRSMQSGQQVNMSAKRLKPGRKTNKKLTYEQAREGAMSLESRNMRGVNLKEAPFAIPPHENDEERKSFEEKQESEFLFGPIPEDWQIASDALPNISPREELVKFHQFHRRAGGLTLPYKVKKELLDFGYDAQTLQSKGLDLFHLSKLANLMSIHASLEETAPDIAACISTSLIEVLRAEIVCFVTKLMHCAMAIHDQERLSKRPHMENQFEVKTGTIRRGLEMMGVARNKKEHFASLLSRMEWNLESMIDRPDLREESETEAGHFNVDNDEGTKKGLDNDASIGRKSEERELVVHERFPPVPLHRQIHGAFMWHASLEHLNPNPLLPPEFSYSTDRNTTDVLDDPDTSELRNELLEEEELDTVDLASARQMERKLWEEVGHPEKAQGITESRPRDYPEGPEELNPESAPHETNVGCKRSHSPHVGRKSKRVKSSKYVENSD